jgi:hypothetical protein
MKEVVKVHGKDIRLCLNTLQFQSAKSPTENLPASRRNENGREQVCETATSIFDALSAVLTLNSWFVFHLVIQK